MKNSRYTNYHIEKEINIAELPKPLPLLPRLLASFRKIPRAGQVAIFCALLALVVMFVLYSLAPTYHQHVRHIRSVSDHLAIVQISSRTQAVVDMSTGRELIGFRDGIRYEHFVFFTRHEGTVIVERWNLSWWNWPSEAGLWGRQFALIDVHTGRQIIPFGRYDNIWQAFDGMAAVVIDDFMGLIDIETGEELLPSIYQQIGYASNGMVQARIDGLWGIIEIETGQVIIPFEFDYIITGWIDDGLAQVSLNEQRGLFEIPNGREIVPIGIYRQFLCVTGNIARVNAGGFPHNMIFGIIDIETGEELIPIGRYDHIRHIFNGMAIVEYDDDSIPWRSPTHVGLVNVADGTELIPMGMFDNLSISFSIRNFAYDIIVARQDGRMGVVDIHTHQEVIPFGQYDGIHLFSDGLAAVLRNNRWYFTRIPR